MNWVAVALAVVVAAATATLTPPALRWASTGPRTEVDGGVPPDYAPLATRRFIAAVLTTTLTAGLVAYLATPTESWLAWTALVAPLALAVCVDARTTWVPRLLSTLATLLLLVGIALWAALAGDPTLALRALVGAAVCGLFFGAVRIASGGQLGMFDVRLAALIGAVTAPHAANLAMAAVFLGTLAGALWGLVHRLARGRGAFAYGPPLWAGPFLALLVVGAS